MGRYILPNVLPKGVRLSKLALILFAALTASTAHGQASAGTLDHVRILVRDINACDDVYRKLGFDLLDQPSLFPEGSAHNLASLSGDDSYIELIGVADRQKLSTIRPWIVEFIQNYQGAHSVGFVVPSAKTKSDDLAKKGIDAPVFDLVPSKSDAKPIELVTPQLSSLSEGSIFFLEYPSAEGTSKSSTPAVGTPESSPPNPNTATGILGVWIGVKSLTKAKDDAMKLGFRPGRSVESSSLGATGVEMVSTRGKIVLLEAEASGATSEFARERGSGIMGLSFAVSDIAKAKFIVERATNRKFSEHEGFYGRSLLIPPDLTCGVWIEMVQHR